MQVTYLKTVEVDSEASNLDYSVYNVYSESGRHMTNLYKHNEGYYNLFENVHHETIEDCVKSIKKNIFKSK